MAVAAVAAASAAAAVALRLLRSAAERRGRDAALFSMRGEGVRSSSTSPSSDMRETTDELEPLPLTRQLSEPSVQLQLGVSDGPPSGVGSLPFVVENESGEDGAPGAPGGPGGRSEAPEGPLMFASAPSFSEEGKGFKELSSHALVFRVECGWGASWGASGLGSIIRASQMKQEKKEGREERRGG